ncbi:MAG: hydrogenase [Treponema sp.]|nr:hydrogenase [Treponema sp.]HBB15418.1 hydrogenase [Treponema sp.]
MNCEISEPRFTCALGAQNTVLAIPRAIPIVHAGPGCSSIVSAFAQSGYQGEAYAGGNQVPSTNTDESNVVFGGERDLRSEIESAMQVMKGDLFVVLSGCTAGIIGDNVEEIAKDYAVEGLPIVGTDTPGFKGNAYHGHEAVIKAIINQYVGNVKPNVQKGLVNVFADVPAQNPFWRGDFEQLKILVEKLGLKVNILFGPSSRGVEEWKDIPNAEFNILVSPWVGLEVVELLKKKYGTPYLHYPILPIGALQSNDFLRSVAAFAGIDKEVAEEVIQKEKKRYYEYFVDTADFFSSLQNNLPYELYVSGDSLTTFGVTKYLENEVGYIPSGIFVTDNPNQKNEEKLRELFAKEFPNYADKIFFEIDSEKIRDRTEPELKKTNRALVLGSDWEKVYTKQSGNLFQYISAPIHQQLIVEKSYVGYRGGLRLLEDIYNTLFEGKTITNQTYQAKLA